MFAVGTAAAVGDVEHTSIRAVHPYHCLIIFPIIPNTLPHMVAMGMRRIHDAYYLKENFLRCRDYVPSSVWFSELCGFWCLCASRIGAGKRTDPSLKWVSIEVHPSSCRTLL